MINGWVLGTSLSIISVLLVVAWLLVWGGSGDAVLRSIIVGTALVAGGTTAFAVTNRP